MFGAGFFTGVVWGMVVLVWFLVYMGWTPHDIRKQAFERGHMVQCVGKTGYYWECE